MNKALKQIIGMKAALWGNAFLYYVRRLWLVGKRIPESLYGNYELKKILSVVAVVFRQIGDFFGKPVYLLLAVGLPAVLMTQGEEPASLSGWACAVNIFFFLSGWVGSFGDSQVFAVTRDKVTCIKYMRMSARLYTHSALLFHYVPFFIYYLPSLAGMALLLGGTLLQGLILWLMLLGIRLAGEAFQLLIFDRTGKVLCRNMLFSWIVIGVGLGGGYGLTAAGISLAPVLLHPLAVPVYLVLGAAGLYYLSVYRRYEQKLPRALDLQYLMSSLMKNSSGAGFKEVEIQERDLNRQEAAKAQARHLKGYAYLNALFFARHRRQLLKPVCYRLAVTAVLFAGAVALAVLEPDTARKIGDDLTLILPAFVFIMYCMTVADKACRAMFYNCDKDMLRYAYYRQPQVILQNFRIRLLRVSLYNAVVGAAICLAAVGFCLACGAPVFTLQTLLFCVAILLLSVLFTTHHLFLYYVFQPYSESLQIKNPFFTVINTAMYMLCLVCLQIDVGGAAFTLAVLIFTVLYIAGALFLVYRRAPRSFRVK